MCVSVKCVQHRCAHEIHVITHVCIIQNVLMRYSRDHELVPTHEPTTVLTSHQQLRSRALGEDAIFLRRVDAGDQLQREQGVLVGRTIDLETQVQLKRNFSGACPGMNGISSSRRSLNVSLRKRFHCDNCIQ